MKYFVELSERTFEVEVEPEGVRVDGEPVSVDLDSSDGSSLWHLVADGRSHTVQARRSDGRGEWEIELDGRRHQVTALDERRRVIRELAGAAAAAHGPVGMKAPMPGLIIAVETAADEVVSEGQGLVLIEAMKMENELKAPVSGRVIEVKVSAGQPVDKGETLLVIEPETSD